MLHHCNIDRIYAVYQDYWNQDLIAKNALTDNEYTAGRTYGRDDPLPYDAAGNYPRFFWKSSTGGLPTPRDLHHNFGDLIKVTYVNDHLGLILSSMPGSSYRRSNNRSWVELATGDVPIISCSRRLEGDKSESLGAISSAKVNAALGIPEDVPPFYDIAARIMWSNLTSEGQSGSDAINTIAYRTCAETGNKIMASAEWIAMSGMPREFFRCFRLGDPSACAPKIDIASSDSALLMAKNPVQILNYNESSVAFSLSQVWKPGTVDMVALHYTMAADGLEHCETIRDVFTGEFGTFEAQCEDGSAAVMLYVNDASISVSAPRNWITTLCGSVGIPFSGTQAHSIAIPCNLEKAQCLLPSATEPLCDGTPRLVVGTDNFESPESANSWVFSKTDMDKDLGTFLKPKRGTSKTYRVPATANRLFVTMEVFELDCSKATHISFFVGTAAVDLGTFDCVVHDGRRLRSGDIGVKVFSETNTIDMVVLTIPPKYYRADGRLTLGLSNKVIGIGSVTVSADCTDQIPAWKDPAVLSIIDQVSKP